MSVTKVIQITQKYTPNILFLYFVMPGYLPLYQTL